ncbi:MAG: hypothetical protein Pg6C_19640 [Treponemataceae bacterium]|nr:MAG: hypothetical protein Pg6C_19640 [Treponemataceae bacterium]
MRKILLYLTIVLVSIVGLVSCLNPIAFNPDEFSLNLVVSGELDTRDITAASTYIVNMSKTLDFTDVTITQRENEKLANASYLVSQFNNTADIRGEWKIIKTRYIQASDTEYEMGLSVQNHQAGMGRGSPNIKKWTDVYATQSKGIYYVWMYRTKDQEYIQQQKDNGVPNELADVVVVSPNDPNLPRPFPKPNPDDTNTTINIDAGVGNNADILDVLNKIANALINANGGNSETKPPEDENGSVPPVISPANRNQMGTFVLVNLSRSRNIDWVEFVDQGRTYTSGSQTGNNIIHVINSVIVTYKGQLVNFSAVAAQDRSAIALMQGQYKITAGHNGNEKTAFKTGVIVPSNDPQSIKEHYMYFYKDKGGNYVINTEKPGNEDIDSSDVLPPPGPDRKGVGRITLVNKTASAVLNSLTLTSKESPSRGDYTWGFNRFMRKAPINPGYTDDVDVIGTVAFPIDGYFLASVEAMTAQGTAIITRLVYLNNTIAEIIVTDKDVNLESGVPGATITVHNNTAVNSVVNNISLIDSADPSHSRTFITNVTNGSSGSFTVLNSIGMPITQTSAFDAEAAVTVSKQYIGTFNINGQTVIDPIITNTGSVPVTLSPDNKLYGANGPSSCLRSIVISDADIAALVPASPAPVPSFIPVEDVVIVNGIYHDDGINFFTADGHVKTIEWNLVPDDTTFSAGFWSLGNDANVPGKYGLGPAGQSRDDVTGRLLVNPSSPGTTTYVDVAYVIPNGKAPGTRVTGTFAKDNVTGLVFDPAKDFVKVFRLKDPPPAPTPSAFTNGIIFNYIGGGAGTNSKYPGGEWSVNMIEIVRRPGAITWQKYQTSPYPSTSQPTASLEGSITFNPDGSIKDPGRHSEPAVPGSQLPQGWDNVNKISGPGVKGDAAEKGWWGNGNYETGKSGWHWQANPMDELWLYFGGTAESWIKGNLRGNYKALQTASGGIYSGFTYVKNNQPYVNNYFGEVEPYFVGSYDLTKPDGGPTSSATTSYRGPLGAGGFIRDSNGDNKLNVNGEQFWIPALPTDQGVLWLRLRMDYKSDAAIGYWWKAVNLLEWFVFNPGTNYKKDANGNIIIDVNLSEPYMTYRK